MRKFSKKGDQFRVEDWLPAGWKVEIRVRKTGKKDRYYIDPAHGYIFRSLKDIDRYLLTGKLGKHVTKTRPKEWDSNEVILAIKSLTDAPKKKNLPQPSEISKSCPVTRAQKLAESFNLTLCEIAKEISTGNASKKGNKGAQNSKLMTKKTSGSSCQKPAGNASKKEEGETQNSKEMTKGETQNSKEMTKKSSADSTQKTSGKLSKEGSGSYCQKPAGSESRKEDSGTQNTKEMTKKSPESSLKTSGNLSKKEDPGMQMNAANTTAVISDQKSSGIASKKEDMGAQKPKELPEMLPIIACLMASGTATENEDTEGQNSKKIARKPSRNSRGKSSGNATQVGKNGAQISSQMSKDLVQKKISRCSSSRKRKSAPFFILEPDQGGDEEGIEVDIPNLSEIIDSIRKEQEGNDAIYVSAPEIGALLGEKMSETRTIQDTLDNNPFAMSMFRDSFRPNFPGMINPFSSPYQDLYHQEKRMKTLEYHHKTRETEEFGNPLLGNNLLTDPCIDFAFKTLTGGVPPVMEDSYFQQQFNSSHIFKEPSAPVKTNMFSCMR